MSERNGHRLPTGKTVALIGYMGSGKSTVGRLLACELGLDFIDLDAEVEKAAGTSIPEIFAAEGEPGFRDLEQESLREAVGREAVISCGGGVVTRPENLDLLRNVTTVFIEEDLEVLFRRTRDAGRPLRGDGFDGFRARYAEREALYDGAAHLTVRPEGRGQAAVAREISRKIAEGPRG